MTPERQTLFDICLVLGGFVSLPFAVWALWKLHLLFFAACIVAGLAIGQLVISLTASWRVARVLRKVPSAPGGDRPLGHIWSLWNSTPWELLTEWLMQNPPIVKVNIFLRKMVLVGSPEALKEVYQTKFRSFAKDVDFGFLPFLPILGTGLVTAHGELWQKQRLLMAPTLRVDILKRVISLTTQAVTRLNFKLEAAKASKTPIELEEEFRLMTLQIIGGAILSLSPEECDEVYFCSSMHTCACPCSKSLQLCFVVQHSMAGALARRWAQP